MSNFRTNTFISFLLLVTIACGFMSCGSEKVIELDNHTIASMKFDQLPLSVQQVVEQNLTQIGKYGDFFACTDTTVTFQYGRSGRGKSWLEEINSNKHHFFVNGWHLTLQGNHGDPFILDGTNLYYTDELNFFAESYKSCSYLSIDLSGDIVY